MRRILRYAHDHGVRDAVLNLHYLPETITSRVGDGTDLGLHVRYSFESPVLGSAGGPRKALSLLPHEDFFIINGDTLTSVDLQALAHSHRETGALVTIAVMPNRWPDRYGGLVVDSSGRFHSTVPRGSSVRSYHVVGVQMAHPSAFARLPLNEPAESIGGVYRSLVAENLGAVRAFLCEADFWDVGTPADYLGRRDRSANERGALFPTSDVVPLSIRRRTWSEASSGTMWRSPPAPSLTAASWPMGSGFRLVPGFRIAPSFNTKEPSS